jgi:hypothetical protein
MTSKSQPRLSGRITGMFKFAGGVIVGASLTCAVASATQVSNHDGLFWKGLGNQDKTAYVDGFTDAMHSSLGKLDNLKVAAALFHWKGANKILNELARGLDMSGLPPQRVVAYLNDVYSNPRYGDFDVSMAIEAASMRGVALKAASDSTSSPAAASSNPSK